MRLRQSIQLKMWIFAVLISIFFIGFTVAGWMAVENIRQEVNHAHVKYVATMYVVHHAMRAVEDEQRLCEYRKHVVMKPEEFDVLRLDEGKFKEFMIVFDMFSEAVILGSESGAFKRTAGGLIYAMWVKKGFKNQLKVTQASQKIKELFTEAQEYHSKYTSNALLFLKTYRRNLRLELLGEKDEATEALMKSNFYLEEMKKYSHVLNKLFQAIENELFAHLAHASVAIKNKQNMVFLILLMVAIAFLASILIFTVSFNNKFVVAPIQRLMRDIADIGRGEIEKRVNIGRDDEIGLLAASFNKMLDDLQKSAVSRNYMDNILKSMTDCLIVMSRERIIKTVNTATLKLFGYSEDELIGQDIKMLICEGDKPSLPSDHISPKNTGGQLFNYEAVCKTKDGELIPMWIGGSIIMNRSDTIDSIVCVAKDVRAQKKAIRDLKEQVSFTDRIINSLTHPFYVIDVKTHEVITGNLASGFNQVQKPITCHKLTHKSDAPCNGEHVCPVEILKKTKRHIVTEHIHYDVKGRKRIVEVHGYPVLSDANEVIQMIEYSIDVTDRKKAEEERRKAALYIDLMGDALIILDANARVIKVNTSAVQLWGFSRQEDMIGLGLHDLVPAEEIEKIKEMVSVGAMQSFEMLIHTRSGIKVPVLLTGSLTRGGDKNSDEFIGLFKDIAARKKSEEERVLLEKELQQAHKLEAIGTLAAGIAHEINTPIQFIANNARFLEKGMDRVLQLLADYHSLFAQCEPGKRTDEVVKKAQELESAGKLNFLKDEIPRALSQSQEGVNRVSKIVSAMKDFSHMGSGEMVNEDINKAIESTIVISRNEWKYVADLEADLDSSLPLVKCFIGEIKQVVLNLIVNAAHAIKEVIDEKTNERGKITIRTFSSSDAVFITVEDTGGGIPKAIQDKVFDHFFTTKEVGKGTGQGLSMAYQTIVEKHSGKLTFKSEISKGTTFTVELPIQ